MDVRFIIKFGTDTFWEHSLLLTSRTVVIPHTSQKAEDLEKSCVYKTIVLFVMASNVVFYFEGR
jgi:hypothetical protein